MADSATFCGNIQEDAPGDSVRRDSISRREPFVRPAACAQRASACLAVARWDVGERRREKRRYALTLTGGRGGPRYSTIPFTNDRHRDLPAASVTFDQTAAKRLAPRRFFLHLTV